MKSCEPWDCSPDNCDSKRCAEESRNRVVRTATTGAPESLPVHANGPSRDAFAGFVGNSARRSGKNVYTRASARSREQVSKQAARLSARVESLLVHSPRHTMALRTGGELIVAGLIAQGTR